MMEETKKRSCAEFLNGKATDEAENLLDPCLSIASQTNHILTSTYIYIRAFRKKAEENYFYYKYGTQQPCMYEFDFIISSP